MVGSVHEPAAVVREGVDVLGDNALGLLISADEAWDTTDRRLPPPVSGERALKELND